MLDSHKHKALSTRGYELLMCSKPTEYTHKIKHEELVHIKHSSNEIRVRHESTTL
jgi:hypothetical protein